jgi:glycosyltransferase involved in cell wall biosynthesis
VESRSKPSVCIVKASGGVETFVRAHADGLPAAVTLIHDLPPRIDDKPVLSQSVVSRACRKAARRLQGREWDWEITSAYLDVFRRVRAEVVLAEFGQAGVAVLDACRRMEVPLVVHFHGADISKHAVLREYGEKYRLLFREARAIVAVSKPMQQRLAALGAPREKVHCNPCGVDCRSFKDASPATAGPVFLAVGRFVDKKAPQLTLLAFARVHQENPAARLRMIGNGPLLDACRDLARGLGIAEAVSFLDVQPHGVIQDEMRGARAFVQHSVEAPSGDTEGTPVAVLEAGASGLPVVATRHAGIPDVVIDQTTGLLVEERDVAGMASAMLRLLDDPALAERLGAAARDHVRVNFSLDQSVARLWSITASCLPRQRTAAAAAVVGATT